MLWIIEDQRVATLTPEYGLLPEVSSIVKSAL
jgi:hypothetical protein